MAEQPVGWPDWSADKLTAAIRATPAEYSLGAFAAERAFVWADPRVWRVGRQIPVTAFAIGPQFEHRPSNTVCVHPAR